MTTTRPRSAGDAVASAIVQRLVEGGHYEGVMAECTPDERRLIEAAAKPRGRQRRSPATDPVDTARAYLRGQLDALDDARTPAAMLAALADVERAVRKAREVVAVDQVLTHGWSYAELGRALGITRQGALKTFGAAVQTASHRRLRAASHGDR